MSTQDLGQYSSAIRQNGIRLNANEPLTVASTATFTGATSFTGTVGTGATTITSTSASALAVGANGATNPVLKVDASTTSVATGLAVTGAAAASGVTIAAVSSGTNENLTVNAKGSGTLNLNNSGGFSAFGGNVGITSASANTLVAGPNGTTNPSFNVDASTASAATGLQVKSAAAAAGVAVSVLSSGTDENLTVNAKGAGTVTVNGTATGNIVLGAAATGVSLGVTGALTAKSGTAVPATAGAVAAGAPLTLFSTGIKLWVTSDAPTHSGTKGDLCINTGGSSTSTRLYVNNGTTTWIAITTAS